MPSPCFEWMNFLVYVSWFVTSQYFSEEIGTLCLRFSQLMGYQIGTFGLGRRSSDHEAKAKAIEKCVAKTPHYHIIAKVILSKASLINAEYSMRLLYDSSVKLQIAIEPTMSGEDDDMMRIELMVGFHEKSTTTDHCPHF